jgi:hypothetical protein
MIGFSLGLVLSIELSAIRTERALGIDGDAPDSKGDAVASTSTGVAAA